MKRIFTAVLAGSEEVAGATSRANINLQTFKAEEDLILIGFKITSNLHGATHIANDGVCYVHAWLTPNAVGGQAGEIASACSMVVWNTVPAAVDYDNQVVIGMFPEGLGISIREEGVINLLHSSYNYSAAAVRISVYAHLYYIKGRIA